MQASTKYEIAWLCADADVWLAARSMLDEQHDLSPTSPTDIQSEHYTLGEIVGINVVVILISGSASDGCESPTSASATDALRWLSTTFDSLKLHVWIGTGPGVSMLPHTGTRIWPGDIVVSGPVDGHSGILLFEPELARPGHVECTAKLPAPPEVVTTAFQALCERRAGTTKDPVAQDIWEMAGRKLTELFPGYRPSQQVPLQLLPTQADQDVPRLFIHQGVIASGKFDIKDGDAMNQLAWTNGVLCVEPTGAAAKLAGLPCVMIQGISHCGDATEDKRWHVYMAMTAAACARQLLVPMSVEDLASSDIETRPSSPSPSTEGSTVETTPHWRSSIHHGAQQAQLIRLRHPGTLRYVLDSSQFCDWIASSGASTLLCIGKPGAGKTIAASAVVQELIGRFGKDPEVGIAYIYFDTLHNEEQRLEHVCLSLADQLMLSLSANSSGTRTADLTSDDPPSSLLEVLKLLREIAKRHRQVHIVVDALDECLESQRPRFMEEMLRLQAHYGVKLMVTSQDIPGVTALIQGALHLEIAADDRDLQRYIAARVAHLPLLASVQGALKTELTSSILRAAAGSFLVAQLYMDALARETTEQGVHQSLSYLQAAGAYGHAYDNAVRRVKSQCPERAELARRALSWLTFGNRRLTMSELREAVAIGAEHSESHRGLETPPQAADIIEACCELVVWHTGTGLVGLVHRTAREHLRAHHNTWLSENDIGSACVRYLSMAEFESGACATSDDLERRLQARPLYSYAAQNWALHLDEATQVTDEVYQFLASQPKPQAAFQAAMAARQFDQVPDDGGVQAKEMSGLHMAAYSGASGMVKSLVASSVLLSVKSVVNTRDGYGQTPLCWAAQLGHGAAVKYLLEDPRANVDLRNFQGRTPISFAAENGHADVVERLLDRGADPNLRDATQTTPLWYAAQAGHAAVVELLLTSKTVTVRGLNAGPEPDGRGESPLSVAARNGHLQVVSLLLEEEGVDLYRGNRHVYWETTPVRVAVASRDDDMAELLLEKSEVDGDPDNRARTATELLARAAENGSTRIVQLLLSKHQADPNPLNGHKSALMRAADAGHVDVVRLVLASEAVQPEATDMWGETALWSAVNMGHAAVVKLLLADERVNPNTKGFLGRAPLSAAAMRGNKEVLQLLLARDDIDLEARDQEGFTPLCWAASGKERLSDDPDNSETVELLLATGRVDVNARDHKGRTALFHAAFRGHVAMVGVLLGHPEIDAEQQDQRGMTPLMIAVSEKHQAVVEQLLDFGLVGLDVATFSTLSRDEPGQRTALSFAAERGNLDIFDLLASQSGVDPEVDDEFGRTPLAWAARNGCGAIVQRLLGMRDVDPNSRDQSGRTPLFAAAEMGHGETVRILLSWPDVDPDARDLAGRTPLSLAAEAAKADVVQQLLAARGVDPNSRDDSGRAPLSWAVDGEVSSGRKMAIKHLLNVSSVDPNAEDNEGRTPMDRALGLKRGGDEVVDILLSRSDTKSVLESKSGQTPGWVPQRKGDGSLASLRIATTDTIDMTDGGGSDDSKDISISDAEDSEAFEAPDPFDAALTKSGTFTDEYQGRDWLNPGSEFEMELSLESTRSVPIALQPQSMIGHETDTDHRLCSRCEAVDWDDVFSNKPGLTGRCVIPDLGTVDETWEQRSCPICKLIGSIRPRPSPTTPAPSGWGVPRNDQLYAFSSTDVWLCQGSLAWHSLLQTAWIDTVFLAVVADGESPLRKGPGEFDGFGEDITLADWFRATLLCSGFAARLGSNCAHGTRSLDIREIPRDEIDYSVVRGWVDFCSTSHSYRCEPTTIEPVPHLRLIECATRKVITLGSAVVPFVALSYVWGAPGTNSGPKDHDVLGDGEVEPVVEDAMLVTMRLGYTYLWVDRYCIVKENQAIREQQLRDMNLVYGSAALTIVAAAGLDATFGLPGVRSRQPRREQFKGQAKGHLIVSIPPDPATVLRSSVWATRGWTYQEGLLSRRRLVFTEYEVSFECQTGLFREAVDLPRRIHEMAYSYANPLQAESWWRFSARGALDFDLLSLISDYTRRRLTYESDILNAMLGIFHSFEGGGVHHLCGVPIVPGTVGGTKEMRMTAAESLANGFLWNLVTPGQRRPGFPSWSWTGWDGVVFSDGFGGVQISFPAGFKVEGAVVCAERQKAIPFSEYEQMSSMEKSTTFSQYHVLQLSAMTLMVELREEGDGGWSASACIGDEFVDGTFYPTRDYLSGQDHESFARRLREESWLCLVLGLATNTTVDWGMVVVDYVHSSKCWERVGLLGVKNIQLREDMLERRTIRLG